MTARKPTSDVHSPHTRSARPGCCRRRRPSRSGQAGRRRSRPATQWRFHTCDKRPNPRHISLPPGETSQHAAKRSAPVSSQRPRLRTQRRPGATPPAGRGPGSRTLRSAAELDWSSTVEKRKSRTGGGTACRRRGRRTRSSCLRARARAGGRTGGINEGQREGRRLGDETHPARRL